jgi:uncharacterized protein YndB with AHSA1/START domain
METYNTFKQEDNVLIHTRLLDAPIELVWEVWTVPEHIKEWWGPDGFSLTTIAMNVETGKAWEFIMHGMGKDWENRIEYVDVKKPSLLTYRHSGAPNDDYNFTVSIFFEEVEGKTLLTMKSVFKSKEIIDQLNRKVNAIEGSKQTLNRLEHYLQLIRSTK